MMTELEEAWRELDADPAVRVIVNAGEGKNFQTGLDVAALEPRQGGDDRAVAAHARRRAPLHRVAQPGVEAGDRGRARQLRRRRTPLRRRRRHRDRRQQRQVLRHPRVAGAGDVVRGRRAVAQDGVRADHAHGAGRQLRAHPRRAGASARHGVAGRRPAGAAARRSPAPRREDRPELARGDARHEARAVGRARARPHRRLPCRQPGAGRACGATPIRKKARSRSPRSATRSGWRSHDLVVLRHPEARASRTGGVADQQPARAAERDEQSHARRVRRRVARARRRSRRSR